MKFITYSPDHKLSVGSPVKDYVSYAGLYHETALSVVWGCGKVAPQLGSMMLV